MERVWRELDNKKKNVPFGFYNILANTEGHDPSALDDQKYLNLIQEEACAYIYYQSFGYALNPLPFTSKQDWNARNSIPTALRHLREAELILNASAYESEASALHELIDDVSILHYEAAPEYTEHRHFFDNKPIEYLPDLEKYFVPRPAAPFVVKDVHKQDEELARFVIAIAFSMRWVFMKQMRATVANIANVVFRLESNELSKYQVGEILRTNDRAFFGVR